MFKYFLLSLMTICSLHGEVNVLAFAGSTREDSCNKKLIAAVARIAKEQQVNVTVVDLKDLSIPFYDADLEAREGMPETAKKIRNLMKSSQIIFIASPNYNGSFSGVLKNALDWASRSENGQSSREAYVGKKFVLMSASPGQGGGARGLRHLRDVIQNIGGQVQTEEFSLASCYQAFDQEGNLNQKDNWNRLYQFVLHSLR